MRDFYVPEIAPAKLTMQALASRSQYNWVRLRLLVPTPLRGQIGGLTGAAPQWISGYARRAQSSLSISIRALSSLRQH
jgi:hypothetical protein